MPSWCTVITATLSLYKDYIIFVSLLIQVVLVVKNLPASAGDIEIRFQSLGSKDPLEKGMATYSSILVWRIPWTEGAVRPQSIVLQRVRHEWSTLACSPLIQFNKNALKIVSISIEPVSHLFYLDCLSNGNFSVTLN